MTYQQYLEEIQQLRSDLAMRDRSSARKDEQIAAVVSLCQPWVNPGVNGGAHELAVKVLQVLGVREVSR